MDSLERRLIELNEALLKLAAGQKPNEKLIDQAQQALSGASIDFNTGAGNDTVIINNGTSGECECQTGFTGSAGDTGFTGSAGAAGFTGSQGATGFTGSAGAGSVGFTGSQGSIGFTGSQGNTGFTGSAGVCNCTDECSAILVTEDFQALCNNYYIGVKSKGPVTITLPIGCEDCCEIVVKAEMGPPLGNRKITITTADGALIDGDDKYVIEVPYQSIHLICRGSDWHIIGTYK